MCIIAIKPSAKEMFPEQTIRTMFRNNSHGAGLMYLKPNGMVHIEKGFFDVDKLLSYIESNIDTLNNTDVIMHFRIATSGKKDALGCHPYPVWSNNQYPQTDVKLAMVHNGVLDQHGWRGNSEVNDTQVFIKECLRKLPHNFLRNVSIINLISKSIGTNKLAFLDEDGIHTIGDFIKDDGYMYSNSTYKPPTYSYSSSYSYNGGAYSFTPKLFECVDPKDEELDSLFKKDIKFDVELEPSKYDKLRSWVIKYCDYVTQKNNINAVFEDATHTYTLHYRSKKIVREKKKESRPILNSLSNLQKYLNSLFKNAEMVCTDDSEFEEILESARTYLRVFDDQVDEFGEVIFENYYDDKFLYCFDLMFYNIERIPLNEL